MKIALLTERPVDEDEDWGGKHWSIIRDAWNCARTYPDQVSFVGHQTGAIKPVLDDVDVNNLWKGALGKFVAVQSS